MSDEHASANDISDALAEIRRLDRDLQEHFNGRLIAQPALTRSLASFQANKNCPIYRWFKYKEAFSASLVEHLLERCKIDKGIILDPFAGSGTALFAASAMGIHAIGIELLPVEAHHYCNKNAQTRVCA